jgi:hypothetical protein
MTIEQDSLCWQGGRLADQRIAAEWVKEFRDLPAAEQVTSDQAEGLRKGLELVNHERHQQGQAAIGGQDDHFHVVRAGRRALRKVRGQAVRAFRKAEKVQQVLDRDVWQGRAVVGARYKAAWHWWRKAEQAFDRWSVQEACLKRLQAALQLFTPAGELQTRARAEAEVRAALAGLTGPEWARLRRQALGAKLFTFLDRVQEQLAALPAATDLVGAAVCVEGLRRQPEGLRGEGPSAAALRGVLLAAGLALGLAGEPGSQALALVRGVLGRVWRASSLVEGLNSVLRMQQRRQKRLTQGLLDLKRLHWNTHVFAAGKRKGQSPYGRLGLVLPPGSWWDLLRIPPDELRQQLSALNPAA